MPEITEVYQLTISNPEGYLLGCLFNLGMAQMNCDVPNQLFFTKAIFDLAQAHPDSLRSLGKKMAELASKL